MDYLYDILNQIHRKVSKGFTYVTDQEQYGTIEKWVMPSVAYAGGTKFEGDCEDFALACRHLCRAAGIRSRLVTCILSGEGHLVLEVEGWILCNNLDRVESRDDLPNYKWYSMSGYEPGDDWELITN